jgi:uridine kinase
LGIQLRVLGLHPVMISLDNYFVDRDKTPLDDDGEHDFEALEALDVDLFNDHLLALMRGEEVSVPRYDFITGKSIPDSFRLKLGEKSVLILEGIHALNPKLTHEVADELKYRIYISALTSISIDDLTRVPTTDNRLIRRIVRDYAHRAHTAQATIRRWQSVRRGEDRHVFPYQEQADVMFNSALVFELCVLKNFAEPLLHEVPDTVPEYGEARRLLRFLDLFVPVPPDELPPTSILREFVGGSTFNG